jgi:predicted transcriptional regulator
MKEKKLLNEKEMKKKIISSILANPYCNITELAKKAGLNRMTVSKYVFCMEQEGIIRCNKVGQNKLWKVK